MFDLFGDAYRLLQDYAGQQAIDWEEVIDEADRICRKRKGTGLEELAGRLCYAIVDYLDKASKRPAACLALEEGE